MEFTVETQGRYDFKNITKILNQKVEYSKIDSGIAVISALHTTVAITVIEWEEGIKEDLKKVLEKLAPEDFDWQHHKKLIDHNGAAHIKSALIGPSISLPVENKQIKLGRWQEVVLIDFDEKPRIRTISITVIAS